MRCLFVCEITKIVSNAQFSNDYFVVANEILYFCRQFD